MKGVKINGVEIPVYLEALVGTPPRPSQTNTVMYSDPSNLFYELELTQYIPMQTNSFDSFVWGGVYNKDKTAIRKLSEIINGSDSNMSIISASPCDALKLTGDPDHDPNSAQLDFMSLITDDSGIAAFERVIYNNPLETYYTMQDKFGELMCKYNMKNDRNLRVNRESLEMYKNKDFKLFRDKKMHRIYTGKFRTLGQTDDYKEQSRIASEHPDAKWFSNPERIVTDDVISILVKNKIVGNPVMERYKNGGKWYYHKGFKQIRRDYIEELIESRELPDSEKEFARKLLK